MHVPAPAFCLALAPDFFGVLAVFPKLAHELVGAGERLFVAELREEVDDDDAVVKVAVEIGDVDFDAAANVGLSPMFAMPPYQRPPACTRTA